MAGPFQQGDRIINHAARQGATHVRVGFVAGQTSATAFRDKPETSQITLRVRPRGAAANNWTMHIQKRFGKGLSRPARAVLTK